jgi:hypothetical protein
LAFVEESAGGEFDLDLDLDLPLNGGVGLLERVLEVPLFEADLPLSGLLDEAISIDGLLVDSSLFLCSLESTAERSTDD